MTTKTILHEALPNTCQPPLQRWPATGVYQLWLRVSGGLRLTVGRLGRFAFPPGLYVYTGRASRGLPARVERHLRVCHGCVSPVLHGVLLESGHRGIRSCRRPLVRKHWHIDYLLARREVRIERVVLASRRPEDECTVNQATGGRIVAPGFGASDCRNHCGAHLLLHSNTGWPSRRM